jgi:hypothetical protein
MGNFHQAIHLRQEMDVTHLTGGSVQKYASPDLDIAGSGVVVDGILYWTLGGDHVSKWRWTGTSFVELGPDEVRTLRGKYGYSKDQLKREGWEEIRYTFHGENKVIPLVIEDQAYHVSCISEELGHGARHLLVTLHGDGGAPVDEVLLDLSTAFRPARPDELEAIERATKP